MSHPSSSHYPSSPRTYLIDDCSPPLPIARKIRAYAKPHWLPVTLRPAEPLKVRQRPLTREASSKARVGRSELRFSVPPDAPGATCAAPPIVTGEQSA
jgi:hypothetical protein